MTRIMRSKTGQSTAEYAIIIALVLGAVVGMQTYVRRALNARIADATDNVLPDTVQTGSGETRNKQFEPNYSESNFATDSQVGSANDVNTPANVVLSDADTDGISEVKADYGSRTSRSGTQTEHGVQ